MKTNRLVHNITKAINNGRETLTARIMLADDGRNGHCDFSVTGEIYQAGKPRIDRYMVTCGAIGDTVAKHCPEFALLNSLHLCDYAGVPMHAISNMHFHLRNKFSSGALPGSPEHKTEFCDYYRILPSEFDALAVAESETHFATIFVELPILERWKSEAQQAIAQLEQLTGNEFQNDSTRSNLRLPSPEAQEAERARIASGYYSQEAQAARAEAKRAAKRLAIVQEAEAEKRKVELELAVTLAIFDCGVPEAHENAIFYSHTKQVKLNWRHYGEQLTPEQIAIVKATKLPEGVTFQN